MKRLASVVALTLLTTSGNGIASTESARPAGESYLLHCSGCHGRDGSGTQGVVPTLHGLGNLITRKGGRTYLVRVPGVAQSPVDDTELAALLNWVIARFSTRPADRPYTAEEVGALRLRPLRDPSAARPIE